MIDRKVDKIALEDAAVNCLLRYLLMDDDDVLLSLAGEKSALVPRYNLALQKAKVSAQVLIALRAKKDD